MSDRQKETEEPIEKKHEVLIKSFKRKAYWTFEEGIYHLLPPEYRQGGFPIQFVINNSLFDDIKRDVEAGRLKTINTRAEISKIVNYDLQAEWEKFDKENPREKQRRRITVSEIETEKQNYFYSHVKIKPSLFIKYVKANFDRFSEIEIPQILEKMIDARGTDIPTQNIDKSLEEQLGALIINVDPELNLFYENVKSVAKKEGRKTQDLRFDDGKKVFKECRSSFDQITMDDICKDFFGTEKPFRDIKGGILRQIVKRRIPKLIGNKKKIKIDAQALYARMNNIRRKPPKN